MPLALQTYPTVAEASAALKAAGARYLGGGTLVVRAANEGDLSLRRFVRSTDPSLRRSRRGRHGDASARRSPWPQIARHPGSSAIARRRAAVGGPAVRNMATVGGNLFAPSPYGDFAVALLALDATVRPTAGDLPIESSWPAATPARRHRHCGRASRFRRRRHSVSLKVSRDQAEGRLGAEHRRRASNERRTARSQRRASRSAAWPTGRSAPRRRRRRLSARR